MAIVKHDEIYLSVLISFSFIYLSLLSMDRIQTNIFRFNFF